jgi:hypothetical protein
MRPIGPALALVLLASSAAAQPPPPMNERLFPFPGWCPQPPSAISAGLALADTWLGDDPFYNPAAVPGRHVMLSPTLLRVSRQDLRAGNRNFDEQGAFFDGAGAALALPPLGLPLTLWIYATQPVLRLEDYVFNRGTGNDPGVPPATMAGQSELREGRAGLALSGARGGLRVGAALEWTWRNDLYRTVEQSGAPESGVREARFSGEALGGALGVRWQSTDSDVAGRWTLGLGLRHVPALELDGESRSELLADTSTILIAAEREPGWEAGIASRYAVNEAFDVLASVSHRTEQAWKGLGFSSGPASAWRLAVEYDDSEDPWAVRFGLGQEQQTHVPEPRAGVVGLGIGWDLKGVVLDLGAMRRSFTRSGSPTSYDDRVVVSARVDF